MGLTTKKAIDLHIHTLYSDGEYSPKEIVALAKKNNVGIIAITDHDSIEGAKEAQCLNDQDITIITGVELSAETNNEEMHILGYNIDLENVALNNELSKIKKSRIDRLLAMFKYLETRFNLYFKQEDIDKVFTMSNIAGRPYIANLCLKYNYVETFQEAFQKYLIEANKECSGYFPTFKKAISLILEAGGIPILAHPVTVNKDYLVLKSTIEELVGYGLMGIEVYHSRHNDQDSKELLKLVNEYNLVYSGGSDYHGPNASPGVEIGTGINNNAKMSKKPTILNIL